MADTFPPVSGFVLTSVKENSLVDVILTSPLPSRGAEFDDPGRVDVRPGQDSGLHHRRRPALDNDWTGWDEYDRFFSQMVRWSMRPTGDTGKFAVATDVQGSKTRVIVSALDKDDEFLNYQTMTARCWGRTCSRSRWTSSRRRRAGTWASSIRPSRAAT